MAALSSVAVLTAIPAAQAATVTVCPSGCQHTAIQAALDAAADGDTVSVGAGTYTERVIISKRVDLVGAGAGVTILQGGGLQGGTTEGAVITITGSGTSLDTLTVADLTVQGAVGSGNPGTGILFNQNGTQAYVEIDSVTSTANAGSGIAYNVGTLSNMSIVDSTFSSNGLNGIRVGSSITSLTGFTVSGSTISSSAQLGLVINPNQSLTPDVTGVALTNDTFTTSSRAGASNAHDIGILGFNGSLSMSGVTVTAANGSGTTHKAHAIAILGKLTTPRGAAGTMSFSNVTVSGTVGKSALTLQEYSNLDNVSLTNVDLTGTTAPWGQFIAAHTGASPLDLGTTTLVSAAVWQSGGLDATDATFVSAANTATVLDRTVPDDAYQIAAQIVDGTDQAGRGLARFITDTVITTPSTSLATTAKLQDALNVALSTDTVVAKQGTYVEGTVGADGAWDLTTSLALGGETVPGALTQAANTLSGSGTIDGALTVSAGATLAPGTSPGRISSGNYSQAGALSVDLVSGGGASYPVAGTDYDQVNVTGTVTLANTATLATSFTGSLLGTARVFVLVNNDGSDAVVGTFAGLSEGATITSNGQSFKLSYAGGTGNDIVLTYGLLEFALSTPARYGSTQTLSTTGGLGDGAVTYASLTNSICTVSGNVLTIVASAGTCSVTATKAASGDYPAQTAAASVTVVPALVPISIIAQPRDKTYDGTTSSDGVPSISLGSLIPGDVASFKQSYVSADADTDVELVPTVTIKRAGADVTDLYAVTPESASGTISRRPITITAVTDTKTYDGTTTSATPSTLTAGSLELAATETGTFTQVYSASGVGTRTLTPQVTITGDRAGTKVNVTANYAVTAVTASGTITKRSITIAAVTDTKIYDGTTTSATPSTLAAGSVPATDMATYSQVYSATGVGARTLTPQVTITQGAGPAAVNVTANYTVSKTTAPGTINRRPITITAVTDTKTYDGTTTSAAQSTLTAGSLDLAATEMGTFTQVYSASGVGTRMLTPQVRVFRGLVDVTANYAVTPVTLSGTITRRAITITAVTADKDYDGTTTSATPSALAVDSDSLAATETGTFTQVYSASGAGTRTLTPQVRIVRGGVDVTTNYAVTPVTKTGTINRRPITITAALSTTKVYDGTTTSATPSTLTGGTLATGETATYSQVYSASGAGTRTLNPQVKVVRSGVDVTVNYAVTRMALSGTITRRPITITALSATKTYDATTSSPVTASMLTSGTLAATETAAYSQVYSASGAGTRSLAPQVKILSGVLDVTVNYTVTKQSASGTIAKRQVKVTPTAGQTKVVGAADPTPYGYTSSGLLGSDALTGLLARQAGETAGTYAFVRGTLDAGANYFVTVVSAYFTIT